MSRLVSSFFRNLPLLVSTLALLSSASMVPAIAQSVGAPADAEKQLAEIKKQLEDTRTIAKSSLERAIKTTDEIVSGLSARLSAAENVSPETVANILDLALQIYTQTTRDIKGGAPAGQAGFLSVDLLQKLIEVDIQTSIARTRLAMGQFEDARHSLEIASRRRQQICDQNASADCDLRFLRIARELGELALIERPFTKSSLGEAYRINEDDAVKLGRRLKLDEIQLRNKTGTPDDFTDIREHELFLSYWRLQATQTRLLLRLSELQDRTIEPAQRRELLRIAEERADNCHKALEPPKSAREGNIDNLFKKNDDKSEPSQPVTLGTEYRDANSEVRAHCLLISSQIKTAQSGHESGDQVSRARQIARNRADRAQTTISGMTAASQRKLPVRQLNFETRVHAGLLRQGGSEPDRAALIQTLRDYTVLVSTKDFRHAVVEQSYLELVDRIRNQMSGSLSGAANDALSIPAEEQVSLLQTAVRILVQRIDRLAKNLDNGSEKQNARRTSEVNDLKSTLAAYALPYFALLNKQKSSDEIANTYEQIRRSLPEVNSATRDTDNYFAEVLRIYYLAGQAFRDLGREAEAIDSFDAIESIVSPRLKAKKVAADATAAPLLRYLHAYATRALGGIRVNYFTDGDAIDRSLDRAFEKVSAAQASDSSNIEFKFALASVLASRAERLLQRGQADQARELFEQARQLGSDSAAKKLIAWARNGTGPDGRVDREKAERFARESRENTPLVEKVEATSTIFPEEKFFEIYITQVRDGMEAVINKEIKRLKDYYGVIDVDQAAIAKLRDIEQKARRSAGDSAIITFRELTEAKKRVEEESLAAQPYGKSPLAAALSRTDTLLEDEDYGRALETLDTARRSLSEEVAKPQDVQTWGLLALHYMKLAERNSGARSPIGALQKRSPELIQRARDASQRALTRATDLRRMQNRHSDTTRRDLFDTLKDLAKRADDMEQGLRQALSFETNKSYPLRLNEIARQFQEMAINQLADARQPTQPGPNLRNELQNASAVPRREDIEALVRARIAMALYSQHGAFAMEQGKEALQSVKTRLFTSAMRQLSASFSLVENLEKRYPDAGARYSILRLQIQMAVARVHQAFDEQKVALRLSQETIEDISKLVETYRDDAELAAIYAENHELLASIADNLAVGSFNNMLMMLKELNREDEAGLLRKLNDPSSDVPAFVRTRYVEAGEKFDLAREHYDKAVDIRERLLAVEPDAFCACKVNNNVRLLARVARYQEKYEFPRRAGQPSIEAYLDDRIKQWRERADKELNPDSTRFARWYLARALALKDDIIRSSDGRYAEADEAFRKISAPNNEMLADHALLLSDKAFFNLTRGFSRLPDAERAAEEAYRIWLKLPYSVWLSIQQSDLNIPANFAHVANVKSISSVDDRKKYESEAHKIYRKYEGYRLERGRDATWSQLIGEDIDSLRAADNAYTGLTNPLDSSSRVR